MSSPLEECKALLVRRWGEMGGYWGINRTMAEIHALLFVSGEPLCTDDVMAQLHVSRGNASMNLRALVDWGLIQRLHKLGDRKEYFQADTDVWHMFETITRERRRREVEPIIDSIEHCRDMLLGTGGAAAPPADGETREFVRRLDELQRFLSAMGTLFELVLRFGHAGVDSLLQLAAVADVASGQSPAATANQPATGRATRSRPGASKPRARKKRP